MADAKQNAVVIKKEYFDNINTAITSINEFFASGCKTKNFPVGGDAFNADPTIMGILNWLNSVDPTWVDSPEKIESAIASINQAAEAAEDADGDPYEYFTNTNNMEVLDYINAFVGFKALQFISDHFNEFTSLVNGIYSFELFLNPSKYKTAVDVFSKPISVDEITEALGDNTYTLFSDEKYIAGVFGNTAQITLPSNLKQDSELSRFQANTPLQLDVLVDDTVQEAATVNMFTDTKPIHFKYDAKNDTFKVSVQYKKKVDALLEGLSKCNTTDDLTNFFSDDKNFDLDYPGFLAKNVLPFILVKVWNSMTKYPFDNFDVDTLAKFAKSYKSILKQNNGAKRFGNYDLFTTFKIDKIGTMKFLKDFLMLDLYNDKSAVIANNTLLTVFNIFDSRIYLDILYNVMDPATKKKEYPTEDEFVKKVRSRINSNSRTANTYKPEAKEATPADTTKDVMEYATSLMEQLGDMSISDMTFCEQYANSVQAEIDCLGDHMFNRHVSPIMIHKYIGESYHAIPDDIIQEGETGEIPDYMKTRIEMSDDMDDGKHPTNPLDAQLPPDVPSNSYDDLASSIDSRMSGDGPLDTMLGAGAKKHAGVVYNITNNYSNSFNRDSYNTSTKTDSSTGKTTTIHNTNSNNDSSRGKMTNSRVHKVPNNKDTAINNNNNSTVTSDDTKDSIDAAVNEYYRLSSGVSIQDLFVFLESEEPLSEKHGDAGKPPKGDLLTTAMDADRGTLAIQQKAKKGVQKVVNTGKAIMKPVTRTKQWLTKIVDSLIKRDEDRVKAEIIENPSYRTALYKASRIALKLGLTAVAYTVSGYLAGAYLVLQGAKYADKQRLRKEVESEFGTELEILDDKIELAGRDNTPESRKAKWQMMRLRNKMVHIAANSPKQRIKTPNSIY